MRSASLIVLSRWAIRTTVLPARAVWRLSWIARSVAVSRWLVASSKIRISGRRNSARAIASRCLWPPERLAPRSPMTVSYRSAQRDVLQERTVEDERVLGDQADPAPERRQLEIPDVHAVDQDAPRGRAV